MKRNKLILFICILLISLFSNCRMAIEKNVVGDYYLTAIDIGEQLCLGFQEGETYRSVVKSTIFAVGYSDSFIIVKQHPSAPPYKVDKAITDYYIVPVYKKLQKDP